MPERYKKNKNNNKKTIVLSCKTVITKRCYSNDVFFLDQYDLDFLFNDKSAFLKLLNASDWSSLVVKPLSYYTALPTYC